MQILICPCSFKGSLTATQAANAIAHGFDGFPEFKLELCPLADGGEGSLDVLAAGMQRLAFESLDPLGRKIRAEYLSDGRRAIVESAQVIGLTLLAEDERIAGRTSTYGLGLLVKHLCRSGLDKIYIALGGSATADGGIGFLAAFGYEFLNQQGTPIELCGFGLEALSEIRKPKEELCLPELVALCDVRSPLLGPQGAALYFAQKGATDKEITRLSLCFEKLVKTFDEAYGALAGAGAAGGLGAAIALLGGRICSGSQFIQEHLQLPEKLALADVVISGEGHIDEQTLQGKALAYVFAGAKGKPLHAFCGDYHLAADQFKEMQCHSLLKRARNKEDAMENAAFYLTAAARELAFQLRQ